MPAGQQLRGHQPAMLARQSPGPASASRSKSWPMRRSGGSAENPGGSAARARPRGPRPPAAAASAARGCPATSARSCGIGVVACEQDDAAHQRVRAARSRSSAVSAVPATSTISGPSVMIAGHCASGADPVSPPRFSFRRQHRDGLRRGWYAETCRQRRLPAAGSRARAPATPGRAPGCRDGRRHRPRARGQRAQWPAAVPGRPARGGSSSTWLIAARASHARAGAGLLGQVRRRESVALSMPLRARIGAARVRPARPRPRRPRPPRACARQRQREIAQAAEQVQHARLRRPAPAASTARRPAAVHGAIHLDEIGRLELQLHAEFRQRVTQQRRAARASGRTRVRAAGLQVEPHAMLRPRMRAGASRSASLGG